MSVIALGVLLTAAAHAEPVFTLSTRSWDDANRNGAIDCNEVVTLQVGIFDNLPAAGSVVQGRVTLPSDLPVRWRFLPGVEQDFGLTANCLLDTVSSGNNPGDSRAVFDYTCTAPKDPTIHGYAMAVLVTGFYTGPSGSFQVKAEDQILSPTPSTLTSTLTESRVNGCAQADLTLTKSDGGVSVRRGQTVAYTLTYANRGNTAAANTELRETVLANTVFNPTASSAGWTCSPSSSAGSTCTLPLGTVALGASASRTFALDVLPSLPPATASLTNTATIASSTPDANPADNSASDSTPVDPGTPDLALSKSVAAAGSSSIAFALVVRNQGDGYASGVTLTETVPDHTRFDPAASPGWTCQGTSCSLAVGLLAPGESRNTTFAVTLIKPLPVGLSSISNTACASTTTPGDPAANNCASASAPVSASPALSLTKTLASGSGTPGAVLVFRLDVVNQGDRDAGTVTLAETVPAHTAFEPAQSSPGWSCTGAGACTLTLASLAGSGGAASRTFAVRIESPLPAGVTSLSNTACARTAGSPDSCSTVDVSTDGAPRLNTAKRVASGSPAPGALLVYEIAVQNTGNQGAAAVVLSETIPGHTVWVPASSSPGWTCSSPAAGSSCTLALGALAGGGASVTRSFAVRIDNPLPAGVTALDNTACAALPGGRPACDTVSSPPEASPVLTIAKRLASGTPDPGQLVVYEITVGNTGNQDAADVTVTDRVPAATSFVPEASSPEWACVPGTPVTCASILPSLPAGGSRTLSFAVRIASPLPSGVTTLTNTACAADVPARSVCATAQNPLGGAPQVDLVKTYDGGPLTPGKLLVFHLAVTNRGTSPATGLRLREIVPAHSTFTAGRSDPRWACSGTSAGSTCTLDLPAIGAGATVNVELAVTADRPLPPGVRQIANSACVTTTAGDTLSCSDVSTPLDTQIEATLDDALATDSNGNGVLDNGDVLTYTLVVTNPSSQTATGVVVTAALDEHLGLVVGTVTSSTGAVVAGNGPRDTAPRIEIPELAPGGSVTIAFQALATNVAVPGLAAVSSQGSVSGTNFETEPTDDPATAEDDDPTLTPLRTAIVQDIPTLGEAGLAALAAALGALAFSRLRRSGSRP